MTNTTQIRTGRHVVFKLHAHLVFVTKYRKKVFTKAMIDRMEEILESVCDDFECSLEAFDGERDHVHLMVHFPPKVALSKLVNSLKGVSARILRSEFKAEITKHLYRGVLWSPSYFAASCGGAPLDVVKQYIQDQATPE